HFSPLTYPFHGSEMAYTNWRWGVDLFDVTAYADAVEKTGARWVIFTASHGMVFWPGPNRTIDRLVRGRTCRRDLLQELAHELSKRGIRLCLYFHFGATDHRWREAVGINDPNQARMADNFAALFEETSRRYGHDIWGFAYIDDGFFRAYQHDPHWEKWFRAIKAGNARALVGFSPSRGPNVTPFNDLQVGDSGTTLPEPLPARMFAPGEPWEGLHPGWYIAMDGWRTKQPFHGEFHEPPHFSKEQYVDYFRRMADARVPVTMNLIITQDVTRTRPFFNPECLEIMQAVRKSVWG
ncbi:MAG: alpha-L-fucosidase, partial [Bryobacteraceae bacterium]